jgi:Family of unknown function (DUF5825)
MPAETLLDASWLDGRADLAALANTTVAAGEPLVFGRSVATDLALLHLLREATSHAVRLRWTLAGVPSLPLRTHIHLIPPIGGAGDAAAAHAREWAAGYRYGACYYREGPGFVTIKDVRPGGEPVRMTIRDGAGHFLAMSRARDESDLAAQTAALLGTAEQAGLLIRHSGRLLILPYQIRHWPVPCVAI